METLNIDDRLTFAVRRSEKRESLGITIDRDGRLILALPQDCSLEEGASFARSKRTWIYRKLAEKSLLMQPRRPKRFTEGEGHYYLGRSYRIKLLDDPAADTKTLRLHQGRFVLRTDAQAEARAHFERWYLTRGQAFIEKRLVRFTDRLEVEPAGVDVRALGYRWGSCSQSGRINIHWQTALLPVRLIDYVLIHELAHLHEPSHDPRFWRRVERVMPDYKQRKQELTEEGGGYLL